LVLIDGFGVHFYSAAVLAVIRHLPYPWPLLRIVGWIPKFIRDGVYRFIASNRHRRFGKRSGTHPGT
jgi:predicted DCC family thiol-disulfide oxidoreductase YuxK